MFSLSLLFCLSVLYLLLTSTIVLSSPLDFHNPFSRGSEDDQVYAPKNVTCPSNITYIRSSGSGKSANESSYITSHKNHTSPALLSFLKSTNVTSNFTELDTLFSNNSLTPVTGIAFSGGGYRAMLNGAGVFYTLDNRTSNSSTLAGILQGMDYMAGLSGGNWLIGASAVNDFASIADLRDNYWHLNDDLVTPGGPIKTLKYLLEIQDQVEQKAKSGFKTTITDFWGLALGRQLINRTNGGPDVHFSDIQHLANFQNYSMPFPIVIADGRREDEQLNETNTTIYEFNPYEFGSWDEGAEAFYPLEYVGTAMDDGKPQGEHDCIVGFDTAGFVMGTSSSLFNSIVTRLGNASGKGITSEFEDVVGRILQSTIGGNNDDIAYYPNPFKGYNPKGNSSFANYSALELVDGGTDKENIPLWPLLQPSRSLDFILAVDSTSDNKLHWPNGSSLVHTYRRITNNASYTQDIYPFPYIPGYDTFIALGLNQKPTFFGCDAANYSSKNLKIPPLIAYLPNAPWNFYSNTSTFKLHYTPIEVTAMLNNSGIATTQNDDKNWPTCLACAIIQRTKERAGQPIGDACGSCFHEYCWNGTLVEQTQDYQPTLKNGSNETFEQQKERIKRENKEQGTGGDDGGGILGRILGSIF
ncbi:Lysophospholipase 1 [Rhizina undulata]